MRIGRSTYRLVGLDTNVMSEMLRDSATMKGFVSRFGRGYVPCFSPYSLFELRKRPEIYDQFVDFFDFYPCAILKNEGQLFEDELARYPSTASISPILLGFSTLNASKGTNLRSLIDWLFTDPVVLRREREWPGLKTELLTCWLALKANYPPKGKRHVPREGIAFAKTVAIQQVVERAPDWARKMHNSGRIISEAPFGSVRMVAWTIFFRFYTADREPDTQDVFDVLISAPAPHLDAVVTENFQADIYRQVNRLDPSLHHLDVCALGDLRTAGETTSH